MLSLLSAVMGRCDRRALVSVKPAIRVGSHLAKKSVSDWELASKSSFQTKKQKQRIVVACSIRFHSCILDSGSPLTCRPLLWVHVQLSSVVSGQVNFSYLGPRLRLMPDARRAWAHYPLMQGLFSYRVPRLIIRCDPRVIVQ